MIVIIRAAYGAVALQLNTDLTINLWLGLGHSQLISKRKRQPAFLSYEGSHLVDGPKACQPYHMFQASWT